MRATLIRRISKLEAETGDEEVTLAEAVQWSMRPREERTFDNPEYRDYRRRYAGSRLARLFYELRPATINGRELIGRLIPGSRPNRRRSIYSEFSNAITQGKV